MAFCNINQYKAKRLIKARNIDNLEQVKLAFRASAYYTWSSQNPDPEINLLKESSTPSLHKSNQYNVRKLHRKRKSNNSNSNFPDNDTNVHTGFSNEDQTLVPQFVVEDTLLENLVSQLPFRSR